MAIRDEKTTNLYVIQSSIQIYTNVKGWQVHDKSVSNDSCG